MNKRIPDRYRYQLSREAPELSYQEQKNKILENIKRRREAPGLPEGYQKNIGKAIEKALADLLASVRL